MSQRQPLLQLLDDYVSRYPDEAATAARLSSFVSDNPNCFERQLTIGHITGSAWLINAQASSVLLTHHKKLDIWVQLGGHADGDSNIARVAMKEAMEESGIAGLRLVSDALFDIDIHAIPARRDEPAHWHYDCRFLLQAPQDAAFQVSDESHALAWVPLSDVHLISNEVSLLRMVAKTPGALSG